MINNDIGNVFDNNTGNTPSLQSCPFDLQKVPIRPIKCIYEILKKSLCIKVNLINCSKSGKSGTKIAIILNFRKPLSLELYVVKYISNHEFCTRIN